MPNHGVWCGKNVTKIEGQHKGGKQISLYIFCSLIVELTRIFLTLELQLVLISFAF